MSKTLREKLVKSYVPEDNIFIGPMAGWYIKEEKARIFVMRIGDMEFIRKLTKDEYKLTSQFVNEILFNKGTIQRNIFADKPNFNEL